MLLLIIVSLVVEELLVVFTVGEVAKASRCERLASLVS